MSAKEARAGGAYVEVSLRSKIQAGARQVERELHAISSSMRSVGSSIAGVGAGITAGFGSALAALYFPIKLAADAETTQASFEALTGSTEKAKNMLAEIRQFAAATPFNFEGLTKASQTLLAYGTATEDVIPQLKLLGDVSLGNQEKLDRLAVAFGQVQAKGKLMAQEVNQMVENGFNPLKEISRTTGVSMDELFETMEAGGIKFATVVGAFKSATSEGGRFFETMDKQSKTLGGRLAALGDEIQQALLPIGKAMMDIIKPVVDAARIGVASLAKITPAMGGLAVSIGLVSIAGVAAGAALTVLGGVILGVGATISAVGTIAGAIALIWTPVTLIVLGVVAAVAAVGAVLAYAAVQSGIASDAITYLKTSFAGLTSIASKTFAGISDAIAGNDMQLAAKILWAGLKVTFYSGLQELTNLFFKQFEIIGNATARMVSELATMWISLPAMIAKGISSVTFNIATVLDSNALTAAKQELDLLLRQAKKAKDDRDAKAIADKGASSSTPAAASSKDGKEAFDDRIKALQHELLVAQAGADAADLLALKMQGVTDAQLAEVAVLQMQRNELKAKQEAEAKAADERKQAAEDLKREGQSLAESLRTPREAFVAEVTRIQQLLDAKAIDQETANRAIAKAREGMSGGTGGDRGTNTLATRGSAAAFDTIRRNQQRVSAETWVTPLLAQGMAAIDVQRQGFADVVAATSKKTEAMDLSKLESLTEKQLTALGLSRTDLLAVKTAIEDSKTPTFVIP